MPLFALIFVLLSAAFVSAEDQPAAYWKFDELSGGKAVDSSGHGHDGIILSKTRRTQGKSGAGLEFGNGRTAVFAKLPWQEGSFSFSAWAKPLAVKGTRPGAVCGRPGWSTAISYTSGQRFYFELFNSDKQGFKAASPKTYPPGEWHHVAGVFDSAAAKIYLYIDGELVAGSDFKGKPFSYPDEFYIGCAKPVSRVVADWYTGSIDEVKVYYRPVTIEEIKSEYEALRQSHGPVSDSRYVDVGPAGQPAWMDPPMEIPQPVNAELKASLIDRPPDSARRILRTDGLPQMLINGTIKPFLGVDIWDQPLDSVYLAPFFAAGMEIVNVTVNLSYNKKGGFSGAEYYMKPFWTGQNSYDDTDLEKILWRPLQTSPNAKIILWIMIDPYPEWTAEHPDDIMRNDRGEKLVASRHFLRYGGKEPTPEQQERYVWSFFSEAFRNDTSATIAKLIEKVERTTPGRAVIGYLIGGGTDAQLYHWQPPNSELTKAQNWGDYSPVAIKAWKRWLTAKYESPRALSTAWGMSIASFDEAVPPRAAELVGDGGFHDPRKERRSMDWKRFITSGHAELIAHFAKVIKQSVSRPALTGICCGISPGRRDLTSMEDFMRNPDIDFFLHQLTYNQRMPPNFGGINAYLSSISVNGKLFAADWDFPTWMSKPTPSTTFAAGIHHDADFQGWAGDINTLRSMWRRDFARLCVNGAGALWNPVFSSLCAYSDPAIVEEMKFLVNLAGTVQAPSPRHPLADVAVIIDEKAVDYLRNGIGIQSEWMQQQQNELNASGVPFGTYYAADLRDGIVPAARLYIFQNLMNLDKKLCDAIAKLKKDGATLVFLRDTGYEQAFSEIKKVSEVIGMKVDRIENATGAFPAAMPEHPLVKWDNTVLKKKSSVPWPRTAKVFGAFNKNDPIPDRTILAQTPETLTLGGRTVKPKDVNFQGTCINLKSVLNIPIKDGNSAFVYFELNSPVSQQITVGCGADWWMQWWVNGTPVFDTLNSGNGKADFSVRAHTFNLPLKQGKNTVAVRVISGTSGFLFSAGGPDEIAAPAIFSPVSEHIDRSEYTLAVTDPEAMALSPYSNAPEIGFALKEHGQWNSIFVGTRVLSRHLVAALAGFSGAWRLTGTDVISCAAENMIMLHPLRSGDFEIRLKKPASLHECPPGKIVTDSKLIHRQFLPAGQTYIFMLE